MPLNISAVGSVASSNLELLNISNEVRNKSLTNHRVVNRGILSFKYDFSVFNSGLVWAVGATEKKPNPLRYDTFMGN